MTRSLKTILTIIVLAIASLVIDFIFKKQGIPIVLADLLTFPLAMFALYLFAYQPIFNHSNFFQKDSKNTVALYYFPFGLLLMIMAIWGIKTGVSEPTTLFTGIRVPAIHGYSLALLCITIVPIAIMVMWLSIKRFFKKS